MQHVFCVSNTMLFYAGLNVSPSIFSNEHEENPIIDKFSKLLLDDISDLTIGWNYFLIWHDTKVFVSGNIGKMERKHLLTIPEASSAGFSCGIAGKNCISLLTVDHQMWQYHLYENHWKKIDHFIPGNDDALLEYVTKIAGDRFIIALTNFGRVFNVPNLVQVPKRVKFVNIACGFEHTIMLAENGDVYSMGTGSRGQLGHGDLEDCDQPKLIEALAGLKVVEISAAGWHNAVVTAEGDLYTWGWNTNGELGLISEQKLVATPTVVEFTNESGDLCETTIELVQCGNAFTVCILEDKTLWGCGSNKYGQLGQSRQDLSSTARFVKLKIDFSHNIIADIKCQEWGTTIRTE